MRTQPWAHGEATVKILARFIHQSMAKFAANQAAIIQVNPQTDLPIKAWKSMKQQQKVIKKRLVDDPDSPIPEGHLRFVCLSDTHSRIENNVLKVPPGDVLIHAGDFTMLGLPKDIDKFNKYLGTLPHKVKVVIAGNHDLTFDQDMLKNEREDMTFRFGVTEENFEAYMIENKLADVKELMTNCVYLEDASVNIHGINVYGSPWQPAFGGWGFNLPRGQMLLDKWNMIPSDTDILVTHGPPIGHGDYCFDGQRAGCVELLSTIQQRVKPKYHVFGHIHEGYGITSDGYTTYINASTCTLRYQPNNPAVIFDFPLPEGCTKDEALDLYVKPAVIFDIPLPEGRTKEQALDPCVKPAVKTLTKAQSNEANDDD
ncbi:metallophosphoesterase MPPED2-like isoform X2 [Mizuhopecten yessoensis]|uniref:metallophosphoesterase MPPED2-like isoform X2 n=1 Tax=Mizuhopecten yessoensis TaxID=6573 RepID=UPI000B45F551|nr:metallophosphoesterase MPPED2-like isoform X2 [Mizuhopecten yessoensis]